MSVKNPGRPRFMFSASQFWIFSAWLYAFHIAQPTAE